MSKALLLISTVRPAATSSAEGGAAMPTTRTSARRWLSARRSSFPKTRVKHGPEQRKAPGHLADQGFVPPAGFEPATPALGEWVTMLSKASTSHYVLTVRSHDPRS